MVFNYICFLLPASSEEYDPIPETCQAYLPYTQASPEPMFPLTLSLLSRDEQLPLFFAPGTCDDESLRRAVCRILYPPAVMQAVPSGPCFGACQRFSSCPNALFLLEVDCDALDFTVMGSLPGLCTRGNVVFTKQPFSVLVIVVIVCLFFFCFSCYISLLSFSRVFLWLSSLSLSL